MKGLDLQMIYYHQKDMESTEIDLMQDKMYIKFGDITIKECVIKLNIYTYCTIIFSLSAAIVCVCMCVFTTNLLLLHWEMRFVFCQTLDRIGDELL